MRILRKNNTFVLAEIKQNAAAWDNRKVFGILGLLREYDAKSKGSTPAARRTGSCCANCC